MHKRYDKENASWYKLDNAAKLYPALKSAYRTNVFRVSVLLKEKVDPEILNEALKKVIPRFKGFQVHLHRGLFWYYMDHNYNTVKVIEDKGSPCKNMYFKKNRGFLFRVLYYERRISAEFFHSLTDGTGAIEFLKTLCAEYLRIKGYNIEKSKYILDIDDSPSKEEMEDAFIKYAVKEKLLYRGERKAYHPIGTFEPPGILHLTTGILDVDAVLEVSRSMKVSMTEYLAAVLIYVLYLNQKKYSYSDIKPITVSIPVNLRKHFQSKTLRNFSLFVNTGIDPGLGDYTFEEIVSMVHHFMRYSLNDKFLRAQISANVAAERNPILRFIPLIVKNISLSAAFSLFGDTRISSTLTNVGKVTVPKDMEEHIERFEAILSSTLLKPVNCSVISFKNVLTINFTRTIKESEVEKEFFRFLVKKGLHVKVESNYE